MLMIDKSLDLVGKRCIFRNLDDDIHESGFIRLVVHLNEELKDIKIYVEADKKDRSCWCYQSERGRNIFVEDDLVWVYRHHSHVRSPSLRYFLWNSVSRIDFSGTLIEHLDSPERPAEYYICDSSTNFHKYHPRTWLKCAQACQSTSVRHQLREWLRLRKSQRFLSQPPPVEFTDVLRSVRIHIPILLPGKKNCDKLHYKNALLRKYCEREWLVEIRDNGQICQKKFDPQCIHIQLHKDLNIDLLFGYKTAQKKKSKKKNKKQPDNPFNLDIFQDDFDGIEFDDPHSPINKLGEEELEEDDDDTNDLQEKKSQIVEDSMSEVSSSQSVIKSDSTNEEDDDLWNSDNSTEVYEPTRRKKTNNRHHTRKSNRSPYSTKLTNERGSQRLRPKRYPRVSSNLSSKRDHLLGGLTAVTRKRRDNSAKSSKSSTIRNTKSDQDMDNKQPSSLLIKSQESHNNSELQTNPSLSPNKTQPDNNTSRNKTSTVASPSGASLSMLSSPKSVVNNLPPSTSSETIHTNSSVCDTKLASKKPRQKKVVANKCLLTSKNINVNEDSKSSQIIKDKSTCVEDGPVSINSGAIVDDHAMIPKKKWTQSQVVGPVNAIHDQIPTNRSPGRSVGAPHRNMMAGGMPQTSPGLGQPVPQSPHKPSDILDLSSSNAARKNPNFIVRPFMNNNQTMSGYNPSDIAAFGSMNQQQQLMLLQQQQQQKQFQMLQQLHYQQQQQQNLANPAMKLQQSQQQYIPSANHSAKSIATDHSKNKSLSLQHSPNMFPGHSNNMLQGGAVSPAASNAAATNLANLQNGFLNSNGGKHLLEHQHLLSLQNLPYNSGNFNQLSNPSMRSSALLAAVSAAVSQQNGAPPPFPPNTHSKPNCQMAGQQSMLSNMNAQHALSHQQLNDLNMDARKNLPMKPDMFPPWLDYLYTMENNLSAGAHHNQIYHQQLAEHERQLRAKENLSSKDNMQDATKIRDDNYQILRESKEVSFNMNSHAPTNYNSQEDMVDHHFQLSLKHNQSNNPHRSATSSPRGSNTSRASLQSQQKSACQYASLSPHSQMVAHPQNAFNQPHNTSPPARLTNGQQLPSPQCISIYNNFSPEKPSKSHELNRSSNSSVNSLYPPIGPSFKETAEAMVENLMKKDRVIPDPQTRTSSNSSTNSSKLLSNFNPGSSSHNRHNQQATPSISSVSPTSSLSSSRSTSTPNGGLPQTRLEDLSHSSNSISSVTGAISHAINHCGSSQPPPTESPNPSETGSLGGLTATSSGGTCSIMPLKKRIMMRYNESPAPSTSQSPTQMNFQDISDKPPADYLSVKSESEDISFNKVAPHNNSSPRQQHHSPVSTAGTKRRRYRKNSSSDNTLSASDDMDYKAPAKKRRGRTPNGTKTVKTEHMIVTQSNDDHQPTLPDSSSIPPALTLSELENKQLNAHSRDYYKQQGSAFLQDDDCFKVAPKLAKCRACRQHPQQFCRFWGFRKLQFSKKGVSIAGFSELSDADKNHRALWSMHYPVKPDLSLDSARYILELIGGKFCEVVQDELEAAKFSTKYYNNCTESSDTVPLDNTKISESSSDMSSAVMVAWKRAVQMVSEMCDVCDASVFNTHFVCKKCGFTVCLDCMKENDCIRGGKECKRDSPIRSKCSSWPLCNRQPHVPDKLLLTHVIPSGCLSTLSAQMHEICREAGVKLSCSCPANVGLQRDQSDDYNSGSPMGGLHFLADIALKCPSGGATECFTSGGGGGRASSPNGVSAPVLSPAHAPVPSNIVNNSISNINALSSKSSEQQVEENGRLRVLRLNGDEYQSSLETLQADWQAGRPIVMSGCDKSIDSSPWQPRALSKEFGSMEASMINCETEVSLKSHPMRTFWDGFESIKKRIPGKEGRPMSLRLEWPRSDNIINQMVERFKTLISQITPSSDYTHSTGAFNLLARLPEFFGPPDLTPKLHCAYGIARNCSVGTYNLQLHCSDTMNILLYVGSLEEEEEKREKNDIANSLRIAGVEPESVKKCEQTNPGALWQVFSPNDAELIRDFLRHESPNKSGGGGRCGPVSPGAVSHSGEVDPLEEPRHYLGPQLLDKLEREFGVKPVTFVQHLGDAVLVPTGAPFQIRNLSSCISVSSHFVSPESLPVCLRLNERMRSQAVPSCQQEERLQIKNIMFHSVKDASAVLLCNGAIKSETIVNKSSNSSCPSSHKQQRSDDSREKSLQNNTCPQLQPCA